MKTKLLFLAFAALLVGAVFILMRGFDPAEVEPSGPVPGSVASQSAAPDPASASASQPTSASAASSPDEEAHSNMLPSTPDAGTSREEHEREYRETTESRFLAQAEVLDERITPPDADGVFTVERLIRHPDFKLPMLRVEETVREQGGEDEILHRTVAAADRILVRVPPDFSSAELAVVADSLGAKVERALPLRGVWVLQSVDPVELETLPLMLVRADSASGKRSGVLLAEPEFIYFASRLPSDPGFSQQWGLHNMGQGGGVSDADIDGPAAWDIATDASAVTVAVIDSGIDRHHVDLAANMWVNPTETLNGLDDDGNGYVDDLWGWDFYADDNDPDDENRHGTHCAGIIGASGNNGIGIAGTAWQARIVSLRFLSAGGAGRGADAIEAIDYATERGFAITSNSWGGGGYSQLLLEVIEEAGVAGTLFIAAAGNAAQDIDRFPTYPAAYQSDAIIAVASTDHRDELSSFSNFGIASVDIAAPGSAIYSTLPDNTYGTLSGTSMATPFVAGAAALLRALRPEMSAGEIKQALLDSSDRLDSLDGRVAYGRLNLAVLLNQNTGPLPQVERIRIVDSPADPASSDGILSPGEDVELFLTIKNIGAESITSLSLEASMVETDGGIIVTQSLATFSNLTPGSSVEGSSPLRLAVSDSVVTPKTLNLRLVLSDGAGTTWVEIHPLRVETVFEVAGRVLDDATGQGIASAMVYFGSGDDDSVAVGPDGSFTLALTDGSYNLRAEAAGYVVSETLALALPPALAEPIEFRLGRAAIEIQPASLSATLGFGQTAARSLNIANNGNRLLDYSVQIVYDLASYLGSSSVENGPGVVLFEDFEAGSLADWRLSYSRITAELTTATKAEGDSSLRLSGYDHNAHRRGLYRDLEADARPSHIKFYIRSGSTSTDDAYFVLYDRVRYTEIISFFAASDGTFRINASRVEQPNFPYEAKRWYAIEFQNIDWQAATLDFAVDGFVIARDVPFQSASTGLHGNRVYLYNYSVGSEAWWDHIVVANGGASWLHVFGNSGTVAPGSDANIDVDIAAGNMNPGTYQAKLVFHSNAPDQPVTTVPVTLSIEDLPNTAPVAESFGVELDEDISFRFQLLGSDADGHAINAKVETLPAVGTLYQVLSDGSRGSPITNPETFVLHRDRELFYVPPVNGFGLPIATFDFSLTDGRATSALATVTINVVEINDPPIARDDFVSTADGAPIPVIRVLANDTDVDGDPLVITAVGSPAKGTAANNGDGTIAYTPNPDFIDGIDSFTYSISDGRGGQSQAEVIVRSGASAGGDWPMLGGNAGHSGEYPVSLGTGEFVEAWRLTGATRLNSVAITSNRVFSTPYVNRDHGAVEARDISTGALLWSNGFDGYNAPKSINPPAVFEDRVFVQRGNHSGDTQLWSMDALSGATVWTAPHSQQWDRYLAPTVTGNGVYIKGGYHGGIYGFSHDGSQKFFQSLANSGEWTPAVGADGKVYSWTDGVLRQHDPESGTAHWTVAVAGNTTPVVSGNFAVGHSASTLYAVNTETAEIAWQMAGKFAGSPAVSNGIIYVHQTESSTSSMVSAIALNDGTVIRNYPMAGGWVGYGFQPIIAQDTLIASNANRTRVFDIASGDQRQEFGFGGYISLGSGNLLIVPSSLGGESVVLIAYRFASPNSQPPAVSALAFQGEEDSPLTVSLRGVVGEERPVYPVVTRLPFRGTLHQTADGTTPGVAITMVPAVVEDSLGRLVYVPEPDGFGDSFDTFEFKVSDGYLASSLAATATIHLAGVPDAPVAYDDVVATVPGHGIATIRVLANDIDVDGDVLHLESFSAATRGTISDNGDGTLAYIPDEDFIEGTDTITYVVGDGTGLTDEGVLEIRMGSAIGVAWPMLGGDAQHSGFLPVFVEPDGWVEAWSRDVHPYPNPVSVAGGKVFVTPSGRFDKAFVTAFDIVSGAERWFFGFPGYEDPYSINPPTFYAGRIFVQRGNSSGDSQLWSLDAETGEPVWNTPFSAQFERYSAPTAADGKIWVNGGYFGGFYGYDAATGTKLFFIKLGQEDEWTPAYDGDTIYELINGLFQAHDPSTGEILWSLWISETQSFSAASQVVVSGNRALAFTRNGLFCIRLDLRTVAWRTHTPATIRSKVYPVVAGNSVYLGVGSKVVEYSLFTGAVVGEFDTGQSANIYSQCIVTGNLLIAATVDHTFLFDRYDRSLTQVLPAGGEIAFGNDRILVASTAGLVTAFEHPGNVTDNTVPVAHSVDAVIREDSQITLHLEGSDADGDYLSALITTLPDHGQLFQTSDGLEADELITTVPVFLRDPEGRVIFRPDADAYGAPYATFGFKVQDAFSMSAEAAATITVTPVNDAPVAYDDYITLRPSDTVVIIRPLGNDFDVDDDVLSIQSISLPEHGQLERVDDDTIHYYPDPALGDYETTFTYVVVDPSGAQSSATVYITVNAKSGTNWPTYGGNMQHTHHQPVNLGREPWLPGIEVELDIATSELCVVDGIAYISYGTRDLCYIEAIDLTSGGSLWRTEYALQSGPAKNPILYFEGKLYLQTRDHSRTKLLCLDAETGTLLWDAPAAEQWDRHLAPVADSSGIYIQSGYYGGMRAYDFNGVQIFSVALPQEDYWTPTLDLAGNLYSWDEEAFRLHDKQTGATLASFVDPEGERASPYRTAAVIDSGIALIQGGDRLLAIDLDSWESLWSMTTNYDLTPAVAHGFAYQVVRTSTSSSADYELLQIDLHHGTLFRRIPLGKFRPTNSPIITNDAVVLCGADSTRIYGLADGTLWDSLPVGGFLVVADDKLCYSSNGKIITYGRPKPDNEPPVAESLHYTMDEDKTLLVELSGSDSDGDDLRYVITALPTEGTLFQTADGEAKGSPVEKVPTTVASNSGMLIYEPPADGNGDHFGDFTYVVQDDFTVSGEATVRIDVRPVDDPPVGTPDIISAVPGEIVTPLYLLENDYDVDGDPLRIIAFTQGSVGKVAETPFGTLSYLAPADATVGEDRFTYTMTDSVGAPVTVDVTVYLVEDSGDNWPGYGDGPEHRGSVNITLPRTDWSSTWTSVDLGNEVQALAVAEGLVFAAPSVRHSTALLYALDQSSGAIVWTHDFGEAARINPPAWHDGRLYIQIGNHSQSHLHCLDAADGTLLWSAPYSEQWEEHFAPAVTDNGVWINGGYYGGLYGFDLDGRQRFFAGLAQYDEWTPAVNADGRVYSWVGGIFKCHDPITGAELWSITLEWDWSGWSMYTVPVVSGNRAFLRGRPGLHCVDLQTEQLLWTAPGNFNGTPAYTGGLVYALQGNSIVSHRVADGQRAIIYSSPNSKALSGQPLVTNNRVFASDGSKTYIFERASGQLIETLPAGGELSLVEHALYIASGKTVVRYDPAADITFTPAGGEFDQAVEVLVETALPGTTVYYSLSGASPNFSRRALLSGDSFTVERSGMLQAIGIYPDGTASPMHRFQFTILDSDGDGLPDWWERERTGSLNIKSSLSDSDGDGVLDIHEYIFGTDPASAGSLPTIGLQRTANGKIKFSWPARENRFYRILGSPDLQNWEYITDEIRGSNGRLELIYEPGENRFFKIEAGL